MFDKFTTFIIITVLFSLIACSEPPATLPWYNITRDIVKSNTKRMVDVELSETIDKQTLEALANEIYSHSIVEVQNTYINYKVIGENNGYWATTNYTPDLEMKIEGILIEQEKSIFDNFL